MKITAALLAGGESRRMGTDKATLLFGGKPLWQKQLETLRKLRPAETFVSGRTDPLCRPPDVEFVADHPPSRGPLSGLAACLAQARAGHLLVLAIDLPFMTPRYLRFLSRQVAPGYGAVPQLADCRSEPLAAIYPREAAADFQCALAGNDFSLQTLISHLHAVGKLRLIPVSDEEEMLFRNLNEPADLSPAQARPSQ